MGAMTSVTEQIANEVRESYERIRGADPKAYRGFVVDAACLAVAERHGMKATQVVRAYREFYPVKSSRIGFPPGARQPSDEAKASA